MFGTFVPVPVPPSTEMTTGDWWVVIVIAIAAVVAIVALTLVAIFQGRRLRAQERPVEHIGTPEERARHAA